MNISLMTLDDLELELRKLPGVRAVGFDERDDMLIVQLHVGPDRGEHSLPVAATRIAARHSDRPVAVEIVRWREVPAPAAFEPAGSDAAAPDEATGTAGTADTADTAVGASTGDGAAAPTIDLTGTVAPAEAEPVGHRPRLLAVLSFADTDELEVHLIREGRRTIGRGPASGGLPAAVEATLDALRELGIPLSPRVRWAQIVEGGAEGRTLVAVALDDVVNETRYGLSSGASPIEAAAKATLDALNRQIELVPEDTGQTEG